MIGIGATSGSGVEVGVATSNGKAYFRITNLLKRLNVPYQDILLPIDSDLSSRIDTRIMTASDPQFSRIILTTRKERLQIPIDNVVCIEDLGDDYTVAKERLISMLYPPKEGDTFVIGIDPGERTGVAAFLNHREVESVVLSSLGETIIKVTKLLENAPQVRKLVKIGYGNKKIAHEIARRVEAACPSQVRILFVDERGTSTLVSKSRIGKKKELLGRTGTRDQIAAKLIAFREGQEYQSNLS